MPIFKPIYVIDFHPPILGLDGEFNTFRLGRTWSKRLKAGDHVLLTDRKNSVVFGRAEVTAVHTGPLGEMCKAHAIHNHTQRESTPEQAPERLLKEVLQKLYGPHIAHETKASVVIYLRRLE